MQKGEDASWNKSFRRDKGRTKMRSILDEAERVMKTADCPSGRRRERRILTLPANERDSRKEKLFLSGDLVEEEIIRNFSIPIF